MTAVQQPPLSWAESALLFSLALAVPAEIQNLRWTDEEAREYIAQQLRTGRDGGPLEHMDEVLSLSWCAVHPHARWTEETRPVCPDCLSEERARRTGAEVPA